MFMNEYEIREARERWSTSDHPVMKPATRALYAFMQTVNDNSDGWPYWRPASKAATKLMALVDGDRFDDERVDATPKALRAALTPIKSFLTRKGLECKEIERL